MVKKNQSNSEMLKDTLDMMILRTLIGGDAHGQTIAKVIERTSEDVLEVEQGSLYPALHRLEDRKWASSYWSASENNRKAKFYLAGVIATLLAVAVLACLAPAWRASRLDPMKALRTE